MDKLWYIERLIEEASESCERKEEEKQIKKIDRVANKIEY